LSYTLTGIYHTFLENVRKRQGAKEEMLKQVQHDEAKTKRQKARFRNKTWPNGQGKTRNDRIEKREILKQDLA